MDKDVLRIIIIIIGLMVMAGMILWSMFKNRQPQQDLNLYQRQPSHAEDTHYPYEEVVSLAGANAPTPDLAEEEVDPIFGEPIRSRANYPLEDPAYDDYSTEKPQPSLDLSNAPDKAEEELELDLGGFEKEVIAPVNINTHGLEGLETPAPKKPVPAVPKIIQIHLFALDYDGFKGEDLLAAFKLAKLEYGSLKIFERLDSQRRVDFAVASMVEPGIFPEKEMTSFRCPGIVFFLQPSELDSPVETFDEFIETIDLIESKIEGVKLDHKREPLSLETIKSIRETLVYHQFQ